MTNWFSRPKQPETEAAADPPQSLCAVYSSNSPVEAHVVSGMLEDAGIECVLTNERKERGTATLKDQSVPDKELVTV